MTLVADLQSAYNPVGLQIQQNAFREVLAESRLRLKEIKANLMKEQVDYPLILNNK